MVERVRAILGRELVSKPSGVPSVRATASHAAQRVVPSDEPRLVERMVEFATRYGRYGDRRITILLRREGWRVSHKRVGRTVMATGRLESATETTKARTALAE